MFMSDDFNLFVKLSHFQINRKNNPLLHFNHTVLTLSLHLNYTVLIYTFNGSYMRLIWKDFYALKN